FSWPARGGSRRPGGVVVGGPPPRVSPPPPGIFGADAKAPPANSAAVLIKSLFLIRTVPLVVPACRTLGSGKTKEPLRRFRLQREQIRELASNRLLRSGPADAFRRRCVAVWWLRQKSDEISRLLHHLFHDALSRRFVGAPPQELGSMAKAVAGEMVIPNFNHEFGLQGLPLRRPTSGPSAWAARRVAGESGRCDELFELDRQRFLLVAGYRRGKADVMQKAVVVMEAEQQRAHHRFALIVSEAADHAVRAAILLDLLHSGAVARAVFQVRALGDDAIECP